MKDAAEATRFAAVSLRIARALVVDHGVGLGAAARPRAVARSALRSGRSAARRPNEAVVLTKRAAARGALVSPPAAERPVVQG